MDGMNKSCVFAVLGLILQSLAGQQEPPVAQESQRSLTFGVYSFKRPTEVYRDFSHPIDEISKSLSTSLGQRVVVNVKVFKTYEECLSQFVAGNVDFVRFGPASYVIAHQQQPKVQLLVGEREQGVQPGLIVVRKDSPIQSLQELKGRRFAFGDDTSTIGRFLSQAELVKAGIHEGDLAAHAYLDRHDKVFKAVEVGDYDAGALHAQTFGDMNKDAKLRILARFDNVGKPWIARAGLDAATVKALQQALLNQSREALAVLKVVGFQTVTDADFDLVRTGMQRAQEFATPKPAPAKDDAPKPTPGKDD